MPSQTITDNEASRVANAQRVQSIRRSRQAQQEGQSKSSSAPFPILMFTFALTIDVLEWFGINYWLLYIPNILAACIIFPWVWLKRKKEAPAPIWRIVGTLFIEWIPIVGDVAPGWSGLVVLSWYKRR